MGEYTYDNFFENIKIEIKLSNQDLSEGGNVEVYSSISIDNEVMGKTLLEADYVVN